MQVQFASYKTINTNNEKWLFLKKKLMVLVWQKHHFTLQHEHCIYHVVNYNGLNLHEVITYDCLSIVLN